MINKSSFTHNHHQSKSNKKIGMKSKKRKMTVKLIKNTNKIH